MSVDSLPHLSLVSFFFFGFLRLAGDWRVVLFDRLLFVLKDCNFFVHEIGKLVGGLDEGLGDLRSNLSNVVCEEKDWGCNSDLN